MSRTGASGVAQLDFKTKPKAHKLLVYDFDVYRDKIREMHESSFNLMLNFTKLTRLQSKKSKMQKKINVFFKPNEACEEGFVEILLEANIIGLTGSEIIRGYESSSIRNEIGKKNDIIHQLLAKDRTLKSRLYYTAMKGNALYASRIDTSVSNIKEFYMDGANDSQNDGQADNSGSNPVVRSHKRSPSALRINEVLHSSHSYVSFPVDIQELESILRKLNTGENRKRPSINGKPIKSCTETIMFVKTMVAERVRDDIDEEVVRDLHPSRQKIRTSVFYHTKINIGGWLPKSMVRKEAELSVPKMWDNILLQLFRKLGKEETQVKRNVASMSSFAQGIGGKRQ